MGSYSHFLDLKLNDTQMLEHRKKYLKKISELRGNRDILVFAADLSNLSKGNMISIDYSDIMPFEDQLSNLNGEAIDIIIETPGGFAEIVEDLVRLVRQKYEKVGIIIPGYAKSAGTIFAMAGDEILMGKTSALGPIDAQIMLNGRRISAEAFLEGIEVIKKEVSETEKLNFAYIPMLEKVSPGEIQHYKNALNVAKKLVKSWLSNYKFKYWTTHSSTGEVVTQNDKDNRAEEIAEALCKHSKWLTHSKSINIDDLKEMRLEITDYSANNDLNEAITSYFSLLRILFDSSSVYKIYETIQSQIYRCMSQKEENNIQTVQNQQILIDYICNNCKKPSKIQANLDVPSPLQSGFIPFPTTDNVFVCPHCKAKNNFLPLRVEIEHKTSKKIV